MLAVQSQSVDAVRLLIREAGFKDAHGRTALFYAYEAKNQDMFRLLLPLESGFFCGPRTWSILGYTQCIDDSDWADMIAEDAQAYKVETEALMMVLADEKEEFEFKTAASRFSEEFAIWQRIRFGKRPNPDYVFRSGAAIPPKIGGVSAETSDEPTELMRLLARQEPWDKALVRAEARIQCSAWRISPLMLCVCAMGIAEEQAERLEIALEDLEAEDGAGEIAVRAGRVRLALEEAKEPLQYYESAIKALAPISVGLCDVLGRPALFYAAHYHLSDVVLRLLADEGRILSKKRRTALHFYATGPGRLFRPAFERLLVNFARARDCCGKTALMAVAETDAPFHVGLLREAACEASDGRTALELALEAGSVGFLKKLAGLRTDKAAGQAARAELARAEVDPELLSVALPSFSGNI